jgi:tetratricopeptide (TPR) repeat protein
MANTTWLCTLTGALPDNVSAFSNARPNPRAAPLCSPRARQLGRTRAALDSYRAEVAIGEKLLGADPSNEQSQGDLAFGLVRVGDMLFKLGRYREALAAYRRSQGLRSADLKADPTNLWKRVSLIEVKADICETLAAAHRGAEAQEPCSDVLALMQASSVDSGDARIRSVFADIYSDLAKAEAALASGRSMAADERREHWRSARKLYARSLDIWQDLEARKILLPSQRDRKDAALRKIAACDAALLQIPSN